MPRRIAEGPQTSGQLCWHRVAAKLLKRYFEAEQRPAATAADMVRHRDGRVTYQDWQI